MPAKTYSVDVVASVGGGTILAPVQLPVKAGTLTRVFAVGDPSKGTADAVVQVLPVHVIGAGRPRRCRPATAGRRPTSFVGDQPGAAPRGRARGRLRCAAPAHPPPCGPAPAATRAVTRPRAAGVAAIGLYGLVLDRRGGARRHRRGWQRHGRGERGRRRRDRPARRPRSRRRTPVPRRAGARHDGVRRFPGTAKRAERCGRRRDPGPPGRLRPHPARAARRHRLRRSCPSGCTPTARS